MKNLLALILTVVLIISALPVSAATAITSEFSLNFEQTYTDKEGNNFYLGIKNMSGGGNGRGSYAEIITEDNGNKALRLTYDNENNNENYNANAAFAVFDPINKTRFKGVAGTTYIVRFSYKVEETDNQTLQLSVANCGRTTNFYATDLRLNNTSAMGTNSISVNEATDVIYETNSTYVTASAKWTANGTDYPIIGLVTNGKTADSTHKGDRPYASVLIDNIEIIAQNGDIMEDIVINFEKNYPTLDGQNNNTVSFYSNNNPQFFMTANNVRGSHAELISEDNGNKAIRLTYDNDSTNWTQYENYNANPAILIYDPSTKTRFIGKAGKTYVIEFSYKVEETDNKDMQLYVVNYNKNENLWGKDLNKNSLSYFKAGELITATSDTYKKVSAQWTSNGTDSPLILLETNGKSTDASHDGTRPYASVLIDNVVVKENSKLTVMCRNYNSSDKELEIDFTTTFSDLHIPSYSGYIFDGWYTDSNLTKKADLSDSVSNYSEIFVKWLGDGTAISPTEITNTAKVDAIKGFKECTVITDTDGVYYEDSLFEQVALKKLLEKNNLAWFGALVFKDNSNLALNNIALNITPNLNSLIFYLELSTETNNSAISLKELTLTQNSKSYKLDLSQDNTIYCLNNGDAYWTETTVSKNSGNIILPNGFKGYIRIDYDTLKFNSSLNNTSKATLNSIALNADKSTTLGGILYSCSGNKNSTVIELNNTLYELAKVNSNVVQVYNANNGTNRFSIRYSGTAGENDAKCIQGNSTAFWSNSPAVITTQSGKVATTKGYMNVFRALNTKILMQPSVDTFMVYVEVPEYTSNAPALKMLNPTLTQAGNSAEINFSNSIYKFMNIENGLWQTARAGADGELNSITSGFKGYIKFDLKDFKGFCETDNIDFTKLYYLNSLSIAINHYGGDYGNIVIGAFYSVIKNSDTPFISNASTNEMLCAQLIEGDVTLSGDLNAADLALFKKSIAGLTSLEDSALLRAQIISNSQTPNANGLANLKKYIAGVNKLPETEVIEKEPYKNIFSKDVETSNSVKYFPVAEVEKYEKTIEADTSLNNNKVAIDFANEINNNKITDFEKTGIDKMCHVSTFIYANGNIYTSYYANTVSAHENPAYQTARLAYCPENDTNKKIIIDIQTVGDDLYGKRVLGVYDTILMKKENDDTNLYILWTANIAGQYYRLYRIFNMQTETLGEIGVNRFKVGEVTNDFSTTGIESALAANNIGLKEMFSDIGIMQKLSVRIENGETYYYTGAYSGNFTWIIKSKDLITWEYVAQPDIGANNTGFINKTKWENAVYVVKDKVYYFVRQWGPGNDYNADGSLVTGNPYGILTYYDLITGEWAKPVLVGDCQSRSDFIMYKDELYLFYAPTDRNHIGILKIDTDNLANTSVVLQANMNGSCFYPFVQYNSNGELCMSYTVNRQNIRLASFTLSNYIN